MKRRTLITTGLLSSAATAVRFGGLSNGFEAYADDGVFSAMKDVPLGDSGALSIEPDGFLMDLQQRCYRF
ncbi:MAG: hypothetical protein AAF664_03265, partial [Planctomycetota bacterium]